MTQQTDKCLRCHKSLDFKAIRLLVAYPELERVLCGKCVGKPAFSWNILKLLTKLDRRSFPAHS